MTFLKIMRNTPNRTPRTKLPGIHLRTDTKNKVQPRHAWTIEVK